MMPWDGEFTFSVLARSGAVGAARPRNPGCGAGMGSL
jgi:hypothetical protein